MTSFSQRYHNYQYAPGIATYGIDGKPGEQGLPGNSIFFTNYCLSELARAKQFAQKIADNKLPLDSEDTVLERDYRTDDLFIDPKGEVYKIIDIDTLLTQVASSGDPEGCLQKVGIIPVASSISDYVTKSGGSAQINNNYNGLDIYRYVDVIDFSEHPLLVNKGVIIPNFYNEIVSKKDTDKLIILKNISVYDAEISESELLWKYSPMTGCICDNNSDISIIINIPVDGCWIEIKNNDEVKFRNPDF